MSRKFDSALDDCLNLVRVGASIKDCLARYPEYAGELEPLLRLASGVKSVPTPRPDSVAVQSNLQRMLDAAQEAAARRQKRRLSRFAWPWAKPGDNQGRPLFRATMTVVAIVVLVGVVAGALFASAADSLPGQVLYPVKRLGEDVRLSLTLSAATRQELQSEYMIERRREVRRILDAGQQAILEFRGELEELGDDYWIIGGLKVLLNDDTLVEGHRAIGAMVIVRARASAGGSLQALRLQILTNPLLLTPTITSTPLPSATASPSTTPMPQPTATATAIPSSTPTPTMTATSTPGVTPTPTATLTSTPSPSPSETSTVAPTATPTPTHTEEPDDDDTDTPEEHETEEPEPTDEPDSAEEP